MIRAYRSPTRASFFEHTGLEDQPARPTYGTLPPRFWMVLTCACTFESANNQIRGNGSPPTIVPRILNRHAAAMRSRRRSGCELS